MAKRRRTRKQKRAAGTRQKLKHSGGQARNASNKADSGGQALHKQAETGGQARQSARQELGNKKLIMKDLSKTVIVGLIVSGALAGIYFFWR